MESGVELAIIGGGVAGLTAAQYGARANLNTLLIEEMALGGQLLLIDKLENYPGVAGLIEGIKLSEQLETQARDFGATFGTGTVYAIGKEGDCFSIRMKDKVISALAVILASGAEHKRLGIPGEEIFYGRGVSYCATCDGPFFRDKKILVVGGGDAACDEAIFLANLTDRIVMIHRRDRLRAQKALANRVTAHPHIEIRFDTILEEICGEEVVEGCLLRNVATGRREEEAFDAVFIFIGSLPRTKMAPDLRLDEGGYVMTNQAMETNIPGLFAAGDVRSTPFRQVVTAAGEGAVAAHSVSQYIEDLRGEAYH